MKLLPSSLYSKEPEPPTPFTVIAPSLSSKHEASTTSVMTEMAKAASTSTVSSPEQPCPVRHHHRVACQGPNPSAMVAVITSPSKVYVYFHHRWSESQDTSPFSSPKQSSGSTAAFTSMAGRSNNDLVLQSRRASHQGHDRDRVSSTCHDNRAWSTFSHHPLRIQMGPTLLVPPPFPIR